MGTGHQVSPISDNRDRVLLDRGRGLVTSQFDVRKQVRVKRWVGEFRDGFRNSITSGFDWDISVCYRGEIMRSVN